IANAFLVPEATMAQRISRAKQSIKESGIPFQLPTAEDRAQRLRAVLHVLYLIFNEGYASSAGPQLRRADLSDEAIRLMRIVYDLQPDNTEVAGLLALMLLTDARRAARTGPEELVPLAQQNRALWDRQQIAEGIALLSAALPKGAVGPYQLQAAIAAVHDEAARTEDTDWPQILALYELLKHMSDNPMIVLNHAVAAAMVHGPRKGLELLNALDSDPRLAERHRLEAVRAHLLEMAGEHEEAARTEDTDWPQILALYELLKHMSDNPMIVLNHAVAAAMVHGPRKGLELLNALDSDPRLAERHRLEAVRAHLLEMAGEHE